MYRLTSRAGEAVYQFCRGECVAMFRNRRRVDTDIVCPSDWRYVPERSLTPEDWAAVRAWREKQNEHKE